MTWQGRTRPGKVSGGYFLDGKAFDINPTVILNDDMPGHDQFVVLARQDTWRGSDGTERELRGEEKEASDAKEGEGQWQVGRHTKFGCCWKEEAYVRGCIGGWCHE